MTPQKNKHFAILCKIVLLFLLCTPVLVFAQAKPKTASGNTQLLDLSSKGINATVTVPKNFKIIDDEYEILFGDGKNVKIKIEETSETFADVKKFVKNNTVRGFVKFIQEETNGFIAESKPMSASEFDFTYFVNIDGKNYKVQDVGFIQNPDVQALKTMYGYAKTIKLKGNDVASDEPAKAANNIFFYTNNYKTKLTKDTEIDYNALTDLEVIVPITAEMKKYDKFQIGLISKKSDKTIRGGGVYIAIAPDSKEYSIEYANKKEIKLSLYNKSDVDNKELNPSLYNGTFYYQFKKSEEPFMVIVEGLIKTGSAWSESQLKYYDTYKAKTLNSTFSIKNNYKPNANECPFLVDEEIYLLNVGSENTILNNRAAGSIWWYVDSLKISNGMILDIKSKSVDKDVDLKYKIFELKTNILREQYIDNKNKPQIVKLEKEDPNYIIYTNRETNLIGGASKKILSSGMYYVGVSTDGKKLFYIHYTSKTFTKPEEFATLIEFYKKLTFKPGPKF
jgi:hypothetical protein